MIDIVFVVFPSEKEKLYSLPMGRSLLGKDNTRKYGTLKLTPD